MSIDESVAAAELPLTVTDAAARFRAGTLTSLELTSALLDRAKSVLTADQYNACKEYQDWQSEMRANLPRMPNGAPGGGVVMRSVQPINGASGGPLVNFGFITPAPPPAQNQRK